MPRVALLGCAIVFPALLALLHAQRSDVWQDPSPHREVFVAADTDGRLEVLDWGGSGRPLVFLAGGGNTAACLR